MAGKLIKGYMKGFLKKKMKPLVQNSTNGIHKYTYP